MAGGTESEVGTLMMAGVCEGILDSGSEGDEDGVGNAHGFTAIESLRNAASANVVSNLLMSERKTQKPLYNDDRFLNAVVQSARERCLGQVNVRAQITERRSNFDRGVGVRPNMIAEHSLSLLTRGK